jgi:hypothetical protein
MPPAATSGFVHGKIGVWTRAGAALFAVERGVVAWGELPISQPRARS